MVFISLMVIVTGLVSLWLWGDSVTPTMPWYIMPLLVIGFVLFIVSNYLVFHEVRMERDRMKKLLSKEDIK